MPSITLSLPVNGTTVDAVLHANNYTAIAALLNGGIDSSNLSSGAAITDTQLQSANNSVYETIYVTGSSLGAQGNGTYYFTHGSFGQSGVNQSLISPAFFYLTSSDYTVGSKTQKLQLRAQHFTNATAPANTVTFGLYPITSVAGTANNVNITLGTVVSGSTVAFANPAASTRSQGISGDFSFPSDGFYALGFAITGGSAAANAQMALNAQLQIHSV